MDSKLVNSQMNNWYTYLLKMEECNIVAENTFQIKKIPKDCLIDIGYVNSQLVSVGSIAWFKDELLGLLALPYVSLSGLDVYGRPVKIEVIGRNGYRKVLNRGEFVIMYDNTRKIPIKPFIIQFAQRLAREERIKDINMEQQRTNRIWKTSCNKEKSIKQLLNNIAGNVEQVLGFDDIILEDIQAILNPAPFVADKISIEQEKIWNEFLRFCGVSNLNLQKRERLIKDEVNTNSGGTIISRFNRFTPRKDAIEKINELFNMNLEVEYYDGEPSTIEEKEVVEENIDERGDEDVM